MAALRKGLLNRKQIVFHTEPVNGTGQLIVNSHRSGYWFGTKVNTNRDISKKE